ncbi:hypothetical protein COUCH_15555 [Couchioplanes caeruleus]|uniref:hypothetical protein n=1 Tax=Couchioplanes caeruleus TaxID=56438 RepID=UPI0020C17B3B|nr:hypothetical protein [Couchioplanes caeruleus]UQU67595.1 hypothetical protein COUCH_15555 [Couchioplanes caeruleus]
MDEHELKGLMLTVEVPPSGADVQQAMHTARRRNRGRALLAAGAGAAVVAAVGAFVATGPMRAGLHDTAAKPGTVVTPHANGRCLPTLLETPGGATGRVTALDPGGTMAGGQLNGNPPKAILWKDGKVVDLPAAATGTIADVVGDTVVGYSTTQGGGSTGWVWRDGNVTTLAKVKGYPWTHPHAINVKGVIAGWVQGTAPDDTVAVTWSPDGTVHRLRRPSTWRPDDHSSAARDIADDGRIVGEAAGYPMLWWPDGTPEGLGAAWGNEDTRGIAWAIAGRYVYGVADGVETRWVLNEHSLFSTATLPDAGDLGARAGTADGTALLAGDGLQKPAGRIALDDKGPVPIDELWGPDGEMAMAIAISADGNTIGGTVLGGDRGRPAIWRCH